MAHDTRLVAYVIRIVLHFLKPTKLHKMAEFIQLSALKKEIGVGTIPSRLLVME
jgi:hypothetical protein